MSAGAPERLAGSRALTVAGVLVAALYAGAVAFHPLDANDLFWHLATGRLILQTHEVPRSDPFSFASDRVPWMDHEWLWQAAAQSTYEAGERAAPPPAPSGAPGDGGMMALVLLGVVTVAVAFAIAGAGLVSEGMPAAGLVVAGLFAAEVARDRFMVRPETASLVFLALLLAILGPGFARGGARQEAHGASAPDAAPSPWRRGLAIAAVTAVWANVHPASLLAPGIVVLHAVASRWGVRSEPGAPRAHGAGGRDADREARGAAPVPLRSWLTATLVTAGLAAAGTLANPFGWRLWTIPFRLAALVKTESFYNPEWLRPPVGRFPLFYVALAIALAAALAVVLRARRLPEARLLVALAIGVLATQQMRHLGLFAIAWLMASGSMMRALDPRATFAAILGRPLAAGAALVGGLVALVPAHAGGVAAIHAGGLAARRFPVDASERIAREAPGLRLFNDVAFGGYLVWRFFPPNQVFIDGRNELYEGLMRRMGRIQHPPEGMEAGAFDEWKRLLAEYRIEGAVLKDKGDAGMVSFVLPPSPGETAPRRVRRAFSAVYFPVSDWALVYFDDTAMVFVKRSGPGASWAARDEYRAINPEDAAFVIDKAARDAAFGSRALEEAERRTKQAPRSEKAEQLLEALRAAVPASARLPFPAPPAGPATGAEDRAAGRGETPGSPR